MPGFDDQVTSAPRVLVVGASSGVGRAVALALGRAGVRVMGSARRRERLATLCAEGEGNVTVVVGDVRREESCQEVVAAAVDALGGVDVVVYAAGVSNLALVCDTSYDEWQRIFETNVVGAGRIFASACDQLVANRGQMLFLSSISVQRPKPGLVPYAASKAALHKLVEGLRTERPEIAFTMFTIGPTAGGEFASGFDPVLADRLTQVWKSGGFLAPGQMSADDVADRVLQCLMAPMRTEDVVLLPKP
jgi:NADP-dependent 3-hydroxy acid dehydrogenase YdfG